MASAGGASSSPILIQLIERSLRTSFELFENEALDRLEDAMPTSVVDEYTGRKRVRKVCLGDMRVARIRKLLESGFGVTRSKMQVEFHEAFLAATSRHLYMDDNDVNWAKIKAQQGWKDTRSGKCFVKLFVRRPNSISHPNIPICCLLQSSCAKPRVVLEKPGRSGCLSPPMLCASAAASNPFSVRVKELPARC